MKPTNEQPKKNELNFNKALSVMFLLVTAPALSACNEEAPKSYYETNKAAVQSCYDSAGPDGDAINDCLTK